MKYFPQMIPSFVVPYSQITVFATFTFLGLLLLFRRELFELFELFGEPLILYKAVGTGRGPASSVRAGSPHNITHCSNGDQTIKM
jgi:hypothetical protein